MQLMGFSTGAIARRDFRAALTTLKKLHVDAIELSALRADEIHELIDALPALDLSCFRYVSVHAPSRLEDLAETELIQMLHTVTKRGWNVVVHPDLMKSLPSWKALGAGLLIENMDSRKSFGQNVAELESIFDALPDAGMCFDIGHARQVDRSMSLARALLRHFADRIRQLHMSDVDADCHHNRLGAAALTAFRMVSEWIPERAPIVLESQVAAEHVPAEIEFARRLFA